MKTVDEILFHKMQTGHMNLIKYGTYFLLPAQIIDDGGFYFREIFLTFSSQCSLYVSLTK